MKTPTQPWNLTCDFLDSKSALKCNLYRYDTLIARTKKRVEDLDEEFVEEYMSKEDPSILNFLIASGDDVTSKQLRDDLMTLLIAGHETTAAVLTWTTYLLATHPEIKARVQAEVDEVCGDRKPTIEVGLYKLNPVDP
jgi:beta-ring hydroxylase